MRREREGANNGLYYPDGNFKSRAQIITENQNESPPEYDLATVDEKDAAWFAEVAKRRQKEMRELNPQFFSAHIKYETTDPILLCFQGDTHFGSRETAVEPFERDRLQILDTKNAKVALLGDIIDATWFGTGIYEQIGEPEFQHRWAYQVVKEYYGADKLAFTIGGDHDEDWHFKRSGLSMYHGLQRAIGSFPFLIGPSRVVIQVDDEEYEFGTSHRYKGHSIYTASHPARRLMRDRFFGADAYVVAHTHERTMDSNEVESFEGFKDTIFAVTGQYKQPDRFLTKMGKGTGEAGGISFILMPDKHHIQGFKDIGRGVEYFKAIMGR